MLRGKESEVQFWLCISFSMCKMKVMVFPTSEVLMVCISINAAVGGNMIQGTGGLYPRDMGRLPDLATHPQTDLRQLAVSLPTSVLSFYIVGSSV